MKSSSILLFFLLLSQLMFANDGYEIKVDVKNYEEEKLILAHYLGSTIYVDDTARITTNGNFIFKSEEDLAEGVYLLVLLPENKYVEIFVTDEEKNYSVSFNAADLNKDVKFENAPDNTLFYSFIAFNAEQRPKMEVLIDTIQKGRAAGKEMVEEALKLEKLQAELEEFKEDIIKKHPDKLATTILKANRKTEIPTFEGEERDVRMKEYIYRRTHFFDHVRDDPRFYRTKICNDMVTFYMDNLTVPHPDSIIQSVDEVLTLVSPDSNAFKIYFLNFINKYLQSNQMGMDAVFVHLAKEYTLKGRTNFFDEETIAKITTDALLWDKTLIGKIAPELNVYDLDIEGTIKAKDAEDEDRRFALAGKNTLTSIQKPYTVVVFWAPDCPHCKESMPVLVDFYEKHQEMVEVMAVCHTQYKSYPGCAEVLKKNNAINWVNVVDPYVKYLKDYDIETTPLILLLDEEKKILFKKIGADKLEVAIEQIELQKKEKD